MLTIIVEWSGIIGKHFHPGSKVVNCRTNCVVELGKGGDRKYE